MLKTVAIANSTVVIPRVDLADLARQLATGQVGNLVWDGTGVCVNSSEHSAPCHVAQEVHATPGGSRGQLRLLGMSISRGVWDGAEGAPPPTEPGVCRGARHG